MFVFTLQQLLKTEKCGFVQNVTNFFSALLNFHRRQMCLKQSRKSKRVWGLNIRIQTLSIWIDPVHVATAISCPLIGHLLNLTPTPQPIGEEPRGRAVIGWALGSAEQDRVYKYSSDAFRWFQCLCDFEGRIIHSPGESERICTK